MSFLETLSAAGLGGAAVLILQKAGSTLFSHYLARDQSRFETVLARVDAMRSKGYGDIWQLTGAFNLFGPASDKNLVALQAEFRDWYFDNGQFMTEATKQWYFCAMEVLGAVHAARVTPTRPAAAMLYAQNADTLSALRGEMARLRDQLEPRAAEPHERPDPPGAAHYQNDDSQPALPVLITELKTLLRGPDHAAPDVATFAWVVLQEIFSRLRSALTDDIGGRKSFGRFPLS